MGTALQQSPAKPKLHLKQHDFWADMVQNVTDCPFLSNIFTFIEAFFEYSQYFCVKSKT